MMAAQVIESEHTCPAAHPGDLQAEFRVIFGEESVEALLPGSYAELGSSATVTNWLAVEADHFA